MIVVPLTSQDWDNARSYESRVLGNGIERKPNYTNLNVNARYAKGWVAETAFVKLLEREAVRFERRERDDGHADDGDIIVWFQGSQIKLDVKVSWSKHPNPYLLIPEAQFQRRHADLYIGGAGLIERVSFYGAGWRNDAESWKVRERPFPIPTRYCPCRDLWPIESILKTFDRV